MTALYSETFGSGDPTLVLLHGVGANGAVFRRLVEALQWPGRVVVPDLRGHGRSPHARHYGMAHHAADVADLFAAGERIHVVGHSMGGAVALVLASGLFDVAVERVSAFGVKLRWTAEEIAKAEAFAASPVRWFETREAAAERFLRVAGLMGLVPADDPAVEAGLRAEGGRFRLAADNATVGAGKASADVMMGMARAPKQLFSGAGDAMVTAEDLRAFDPRAFAIDGGHNIHVEAPAQVADAIRSFHLR